MVLCRLIRISNRLVASSGLSNFAKTTVTRQFSLSHSLLTGNIDGREREREKNPSHCY